MKRPMLYMVGNTHFDPVWLWTWDEAMASIRATFRSALRRMDEDPDFCYSFATPPVFQWIEETEPALFAEIQKRVAEGRWELAEGWWNQPDCYTASGESYVRHSLYGQAYLQKTFGKRAVSVMNVDSFGHSPALPQIFRKSGIRYYCFTRPEQRHVPLDTPLFHWEGNDGSTVTAFRIGGEAGAGWSGQLNAEMDKAQETPGDKLMLFGVTDHGGAPTIRDIQTIHNHENAVFSTVSAFFDAHQNDDMPTLRGEWITGDFGAYANAVEVKKNNRRAEYALLAAEAALCVAGLPGSLDTAWQNVLFNQFHDILGGCCIPQAYTDARDLHGSAIATAQRMLHTGLQRITATLAMPGTNPDSPWNIVVWNMSGTPYNGYIEAEVQWAHEFGWYRGEVMLEDENGLKIPCQILTERSVIPGFRTRFVFHATVPSVGCRIFKLIKTGGEIPNRTRIVTEQIHFKTGKFIVTLSPENGSIRTIADAISGKILQENACVPLALDDPGDTWAFNITGYGAPRGTFRVVDRELVEDGPILTRLKVSLRLDGGSSSLSLYYTFYQDAAYIDIRWQLDWHEKMAVCKLGFETADAAHTAGVPYGQTDRGASSADRPVNEWIRFGTSLLVSDSVFAYTMTNRMLGLTLVRSPVYGDLRIAPLDLDYDYPVMEQGISEGNARLYPNGCEQFAPAEAVSFANRPVVVCEANHDGIPAVQYARGYVSLEASATLLTVVKNAEDGCGIICRMVHYGDGENATLHCGENEYPLTFGRNEIKTVRLEKGAIRETNLLEE